MAFDVCSFDVGVLIRRAVILFLDVALSSSQTDISSTSGTTSADSAVNSKLAASLSASSRSHLAAAAAAAMEINTAANTTSITDALRGSSSEKGKLAFKIVCYLCAFFLSFHAIAKSGEKVFSTQLFSALRQCHPKVP